MPNFYKQIVKIREQQKIENNRKFEKLIETLKIQLEKKINKNPNSSDIENDLNEIKTLTGLQNKLNKVPNLISATELIDKIKPKNEKEFREIFYHRFIWQMKIEHNRLLEDNNKHPRGKPRGFKCLLYKSPIYYGYGNCEEYRKKVSEVLNKLKLTSLRIQQNDHIFNLFEINNKLYIIDMHYNNSIIEINKKNICNILVNSSQHFDHENTLKKNFQDQKDLYTKLYPMIDPKILNLERKNYLSKKLDELEKLDDFNFILNLPDIILTINNFNY